MVLRDEKELPPRAAPQQSSPVLAALRRGWLEGVGRRAEVRVRCRTPRARRPERSSATSTRNTALGAASHSSTAEWTRSAGACVTPFILQSKLLQFFTGLGRDIRPGSWIAGEASTAGPRGLSRRGSTWRSGSLQPGQAREPSPAREVRPVPSLPLRAARLLPCSERSGRASGGVLERTTKRLTLA
jgi:hypothetical protein